MSVEIIQEGDTKQFEVGKVSPFHGRYWPSIGVLRPRARSIHGIAFNNIEALRKAVEFLTDELAAWEKELKDKKKKVRK